MPYTVVNINITNEHYADIVVEKLATLGFEGFEETDTGLIAYINTEMFSENALHKALAAYNKQGITAVTAIAPLEEKNWNEEWERNFESVTVGNRIFVRAPFHPITQHYDYIITVEPKMAFGTGHHETTYLMLQEMLQYKLQGKKIFDFGCGTGILAIMAALLGATDIVAIDNDEWAYNNTFENMEVNQITGIDVRLGTHLALLPHEQFNIILANINRNVILETLSNLHRALLPDGRLLISGILQTDVPEVEAAAQNQGFTQISKQQKGNWAQITFQI